MSEEFIEINTGKFKEVANKTISFFKQKKVQYIIIAVLLLAVIIFGMWIRVQNLHLLQDVTTKKYLPTALDPFYFLRLSETIIQQGSLSEVDPMRYVPVQIPFSNEILPKVVVYMYKIANLFGDYSIQFINVISTSVFFGISLIFFFFLIYFLVNSKTIALLSSFFLAIIPSYLYRTMSGFSDHEAIGMLAFFAVMSAYTLALKYFEKNETGILSTLVIGLIVGFLTSLTIGSWGGIANFLYLIFPLSFFILWLVKTKDIEYKSKLNKYLLFYI